MSVMTFPAGTYYIGDLCYICTNDEWDRLLDQTQLFTYDEATLDGRKFGGMLTAYGDGSFNHNTSIPKFVTVDAGMVGCVRIEDINSTMLDRVAMGLTVVFDEPFDISDKAGTLKFGYVEVYTGDEE